MPADLTAAFRDLATRPGLDSAQRRALAAMARAVSAALAWRGRLLAGSLLGLAAACSLLASGLVRPLFVPALFLVVAGQLSFAWLTDRWLGHLAGREPVEFPGGFLFVQASTSFFRPAEGLAWVLLYEGDRGLIRAWTFTTEDWRGRVRGEARQLRCADVEAVHLEPSAALLTRLIGGPRNERGETQTTFITTAFGVRLRTAAEAPVTVAQSLDFARLHMLARRLCEHLHVALHDSSTGSLVVQAPEALARPYLESIAEVLDANAESPAADKGGGAVLRYVVPAHRSASAWLVRARDLALVATWIAVAATTPCTVLAALALAVGQPPFPAPLALALPVLALLLALAFWLHQTSMAVTLRVDPAAVQVDERWLFLSSRRTLPLGRIVRMVDDPTGLRLLGAGDEALVAAEDPTAVRLELEGALLQRYGIVPADNLFLRLAAGAGGPAGRLVLRYRGRRLVLDTVGPAADARMTLFGGRLVPGAEWELAFPAEGGSVALGTVPRTRASTAATLAMLSGALPGSRIGVSPIRAVWTRPGVTVPTELLRPLAAALHDLLAAAGAADSGADDRTEFLELQGESTEAPVCQVCGEPVTSRPMACDRCGTKHHRECWDYQGGCSTYACGGTKGAEA